MNVKFKYFDYVNAWFAFLGQVFSKLSNVTTVIRDSFSDIHIPKKDDYL